MPDREHDDTVEQLDDLIQQHMLETKEFEEQGAPVAAVSVSDRMTWAKRAGVDLETVDARLDEICERIEDRSEQWVVPRYRMCK